MKLMDRADLVFSSRASPERLPSDLRTFQKSLGFVEPLMYHEDEFLSDSVTSYAMRAFAAMSKRITLRCDNPASYKIERIALKVIIKVGALIANAALFVEFALHASASIALGIGFLLSKGVRAISNTERTDAVHDFFESHMRSVGKHTGGALKDALIMTAINVATNTIGVVAQIALMGVKRETPGALHHSIDWYATYSDGLKPKEK